MYLKDGDKTITIHVMQEGSEWPWLAIGMDGKQVANPTVTANELAELIKELKKAYVEILE